MHVPYARSLLDILARAPLPVEAVSGLVPRPVAAAHAWDDQAAFPRGITVVAFDPGATASRFVGIVWSAARLDIWRYDGNLGDLTPWSADPTEHNLTNLCLLRLPLAPVDLAALKALAWPPLPPGPAAERYQELCGSA